MTESRGAAAGRPDPARGGAIPHEGARPPLEAASGWVRAVRRISQACGVIAAFMILIAVLITCQMLWVRGVMNASSIWQTEAVIYLMIGATLLGLPYVQLHRGHVNVDLVPNMLPPAGRRTLALAALALSALIAAIVLWTGFELFHIALTRGWRSDTVWGPPLWIPYLAVPLGFGLYLLQLVADLWVAARSGDG